MNEYLVIIYMDIIGFDELAREIEKQKIVKAEKLRSDFINIINNKLEEIKNKFNIIGINYSGKDDWYFVVRPKNQIFAIDDCLWLISEIINLKTGYLIPNYEKIQFEIGVGINKYENFKKFNQIQFITKNETIKLFKNNIIENYKKWYKIKNRTSIRETFIVITREVYDLMDLFEKELCQKIHQKAIFYVIDTKSLQRKSLLYKFFNTISCRNRIEYRKIQELFVPALEYDEIKNKLNKNKIIFIIGTPEYGKTYTAYNLLWDFFQLGYIPVYHRGREIREREKIRESLENINSYLSPKHIFYFEDPFGIVNYEKNNFIERQMNTILDIIQQQEDCYIIITSREEVFKKFIYHTTIQDKIKNFKSDLKIKNLSYDYKKRKKILFNWAKLKNCIWLNNQELKNFIKKSLKNNKNLPTPLSMKNFVIASSNTNNINRFQKLLIEKSKETITAFAKEIKSMTLDKQLFLSLIYIFNYDSIGLREEYFKKIYKSLIRDYKISYFLSFESLINWFIEDKINIIEDIIFFSHSSYYESVSKLIIEDVDYKKIFGTLLKKLLNWKEAAYGIASLIIRHIDDLPKSYLDILCKMAENEDLAVGLLFTLSRHFNDLSKDLRDKLLDKLLNRKNEDIVKLLDLISLKFDKLNINLQNKFLQKMEQIEYIPEFFSWVLEDNFSELPNKLRNKLLLKMVMNKDEDTIGPIQNILNKFYKLVPNHLINKILTILLKDEETAYFIMDFSLKYYNLLSEKVKNILYKIAKDTNTENSKLLASSLVDYFNCVPVKEGEKYLNILMRNQEARFYIAKIILLNFKYLSHEFQNKILILAKEDKKTNYLPWLIFNLSKESSVNIQKVFNILLDRDMEDDISWSLAFNYDILNNELRHQFIKKILSKNPNLWSVLLILFLNHQKLDLNISLEILGYIQKNQKIIEKYCKISDLLSSDSNNIKNSINSIINNNHIQLILKKEYDSYLNNFQEEIVSDLPLLDI